MKRSLFITAMALVLASCVFAQPDPDNPAANAGPRDGNRVGNMMERGMMGMGGQSMIMEALPQGVFVLSNGVLAKFTMETLEPAGTVELFGPLPERPVMPQNPTRQDREAMRNWMTQSMSRNAPAAMLEKAGKLYIVIGATCFCVDAGTMEPLGNVDLNPAGAEGNRRMNMMGRAPLVKADGNALYIVLGQELITVDTETGKVLNRVPLPQELFPLTPNLGGMRGDGANAAARGGRAGRNAQ